MSIRTGTRDSKIQDGEDADILKSLGSNAYKIYDISLITYEFPTYLRSNFQGKTDFIQFNGMSDASV